MQWTSVVLVFALACPALSADDDGPLKRIATIASRGKGGTLDHLFVDSESDRLFLTNQSNDTLDIIDLKNNRLLKQVPDQTPHSVVYALSVDRVFIGSGGGACNVLDGTSYTPAGSVPAEGADSVRFDARSGHVFVASHVSLTVIDAKTLQLLSSVKLPGTPKGFQVAKKQPRLYINTQGPNQVIVIDINKNVVIASYPLIGDSTGIGPLGVDESTGRIFVGLRAPARLAVLEMDTGKVVATVPIADGPDDLFHDPEFKRIYVSCNSGFVSVIRQIDSDHYESMANISTAKGAKTSFYDPALKRLYLAVPLQEGKDGPEVWVYQARP
jgi:DNA-binding beta-propeller fold protein YncE